MEVVTSLPVAIGGPLFVIGFVAIAVVAGLLAHRFFPEQILDQHNDIAGFIFAVVGVVYAVLLAFLAIAVWQRFDDAHKRVSDEANHLVVVYRRMDAFPQQRAVVRKDIAKYINTLVNDEWPKMNQGSYSERADAEVEQIAYDVRTLPVKTAAQQVLLASLIDSTEATMTDRSERLVLSNTGLSPFLWTILFLGAAAVIAFSYLFAYKSRAAQVTMTGLLAFTLALVLYLVIAIDYPFRGDVRIRPDAFVHALHSIADVRY